jgi:DNA-binding beta-propeller fold protein YncE
MGCCGGVPGMARGLGATLASVVALFVLPAAALGAQWTALVVGDSTSSNSVTPIAVGTDTAGGLISAGNNPFGIAVSADGSTAYVADFNTDGGGSNGVTPIDLTHNPPQPEPEILTGALQPLTVAVAPDGQALWLGARALTG